MTNKRPHDNPKGWKRPRTQGVPYERAAKIRRTDDNDLSSKRKRVEEAISPHKRQSKWPGQSSPPRKRSRNSTKRQRKIKDTDNFVILGQNCNHSEANMAALHNKAIERDAGVVFCTEPAIKASTGEAKGMPHVKRLHHTSKDFRAMIAVTNKQLNITLCPALTSRDCATALWNTNGGILCVALYVGHNNPTEFYINILQGLHEYAAAHKYKILIVGDFNAETPLWGREREYIHNQSLRKGEFFEDFLGQKAWTVHNLPGCHTFRRGKNTRTCIDLTISSHEIAENITEWNAGFDTNSDHALVSFHLAIGKADKEYILETDTAAYNASLTKTKWNIPKHWDWHTMDREAVALGNLIRDTWNKYSKRKLKKNVSSSMYLPSHAANTDVVVKRRDNGTYTSEDGDLYNRTYRKDKYQNFQANMNDLESGFDVLGLLKRKKRVGLTVLQEKGKLMSLEESADLMLDRHFGKTTPRPPTRQRDDHAVDQRDVQGNENLNYLNSDTISKVIADFGSGKAPGPDNITTMMLKNTPINIRQRMVSLFRASLHMGYTPASWRTGNVIFIPKEGKSDYSDPKAFRPITLTSFIFKTLEKATAWHLDVTALKNNPLHTRQFAFRMGKSVDEALSLLCDRIERGQANNLHTLVVFMDIQGAFDNVQAVPGIQAMRDRDIPGWLCTWYQQYITNRKVISDYAGMKKTRFINKGAPQGGCISPVFWNIVIDELLQDLNKGNAMTVGFADDGAILLQGNDWNYLNSRMQCLMDKAATWGEKFGLSFSSEKTVCMVFKGMEYPSKGNCGNPRLTIANGQIRQVNETKYLGVILDEKLSFIPHIKSKVKNCRTMLARYNGMIAAHFGPQPRLTRQLYLGAIVPTLTYGCHVWGHKLKGDIKRMIAALNHKAGLAIAGGFINSPREGLEALLDLPPLDLQIRRLAENTFMRCKLQPTWNIPKAKCREGHRHHLASEQPKDARHNRSLMRVLDTLPITVGKGTDITDKGCIRVYTDGSKLKKKVGAGISIMHDSKILWEKSIRLPDHATVFQAELLAIKEAARWLNQKEKWNCPVIILSDSQSSLLALSASKTKTTLIKETHNELLRLKKTAMLSISWIKAHVGFPGNERADQLAKEGTVIPENDMIYIPPSLSYHKTNNKTKLYTTWNNRWEKTTFTLRKEYTNEPEESPEFTTEYKPTMWQTKNWWPHIDKGKSRELLNNDKQELRRLIQAITGFNHLKYNKIKAKSFKEKRRFSRKEAACRICEEEAETFWHLATDCEPIQKKVRLRILPEEGWQVSELKKVIDIPEIGDLLAPPSMDNQGDID